MAESAETSHQGRAGQGDGPEIPGRLAPYSAGSPAWRKSSYSGYNGDCVEVAVLGPGQVGVRDSKAHGSGPILWLSNAQWSAFLAAVRAEWSELG